MTELEGETKVRSMCGHESHCDGKIEAARHREVGPDCYSCHQSAERLWALKLPHRQGEPEEHMPRRTAPGSSLSEAPARFDMTSFIACSLADLGVSKQTKTRKTSGTEPASSAAHKIHRNPSQPSYVWPFCSAVTLRLASVHSKAVAITRPPFISPMPSYDDQGKSSRQIGYEFVPLFMTAPHT